MHVATYVPQIFFFGNTKFQKWCWPALTHRALFLGEVRIAMAVETKCAV